MAASSQNAAPDNRFKGSSAVADTTPYSEEEIEATAQAIENKFSEMRIMDAVRIIGGAMIGIAVLVVVLNEVFSLEQINNSSGSFSGVIDSLESTGGAALGLLVIGLLVLGANRVMAFFGGGGF